MKTILEYIKDNPIAFVGACEERSRTTPNQTNHKNHVLLAGAIKRTDWETVTAIINNPEYWKPLEGVVLVADSHGLEHDDWLDAYVSYEAKNIS